MKTNIADFLWKFHLTEQVHHRGQWEMYFFSVVSVVQGSLQQLTALCEFYLAGFYSGLALNTLTQRAPLQELPHNLSPFTFDGLPGIWGEMCRKDPFLRQWNPSIQKSSFILSCNIVHSINSFIISKTVVLDDYMSLM